MATEPVRHGSLTVALVFSLLLVLGTGLLGLSEAGAISDQPRPPALTGQASPSTSNRPPLATGDSPRHPVATPPDTSTAASSRYPGPPRVDPEEYRQSLIFSGLLGLLISVTGLVMVGWRRRMW